MGYISLGFSLIYYSEKIPSIGRLEAQLKACLCQFTFSKAKVNFIYRVKIFIVASFKQHLIIHGWFFMQPSVLALSLIAQEFDVLQSVTSLKIVQQFQKHLKVGRGLCK